MQLSQAVHQSISPALPRLQLGGQQRVGQGLAADGHHVAHPVADVLVGPVQERGLLALHAAEGVLAVPEDRVAGADQHGLGFSTDLSCLWNQKCRYPYSGTRLSVCTRGRVRDGVPGGLDDEPGPAGLQALHQLQGLRQVEQRRVRAGRALSPGQPLPHRDLGADAEARVLHLPGDALVELVGEARAVGPGAAVLPLPVVEGPQQLGAQVAVAELEVHPVGAAVVGHLGRVHELGQDLVHLLLGQQPSLVAGEGLHAHPLGELRAGQLPGVGELPDDERPGVGPAHGGSPGP